MIYFVVGHRGAGKSSWTQRVSQYFGDQICCFDLDLEIERYAGKSVSQLFELGESVFRELELQVFHKLLVSNSHVLKPLVISLGGGFPVEQLLTMPSSHIIWIKRSTDLQGRIFLDRPRLQPELSALDEYQSRAILRQKKFESLGALEWRVREGCNQPSEFEKKVLEALFFGKGLKPSYPAWICLTSSQLSFIDFFRSLGVKFELRTDLLRRDQILKVLNRVDPGDCLVSIRTQGVDLRDFPMGLKVDWPLELGMPPEEILQNIFSISLHLQEFPKEGIEALFAAVREIKPSHVRWIYKLSPVVWSWKELKAYHQWMVNASDRSFLPRDPHAGGDYHWYRLHYSARLPIQFVTLGHLGQEMMPHFFDFCELVKRGGEFAAVAGDPIEHSLSPSFHSSFFQQFFDQMPFYRVRLQSDVKKEGLEVLKELGLRYVALTSPVKETTGVNTLAYVPDQKFNSDLIGFLAFIPYLYGPVGVWGGGGVLPSLKKFLSEQKIEDVYFYSVRSGEERGGRQAKGLKTLIWAAKAEERRQPDRCRTEFQGVEWVLDLSYREDSQAREFALQKGARYVSGIEMFQKQARAQQQFWMNHYGC